MDEQRRPAAGTFALAAGDDAAAGLNNCTTGRPTSSTRTRFRRGLADQRHRRRHRARLRPARPLVRRPLSATAVGDQLYFAAYVDGKGNEIWRSSSTGTSMTQVTGYVEPFIFDTDPSFTRLSGKVFFVGPSPEDGEVWKSRGHSGEHQHGSVDARPGDTGSRPGRPAGLRAARSTSSPTPPATSALSSVPTGTTAGTIALRQFRRPLGEAPRAELLALDGRLYFAADDGIHGRELWTSDGTAARHGGW